jgi:hypothetical protein
MNSTVAAAAAEKVRFMMRQQMGMGKQILTIIRRIFSDKTHSMRGQML